MESYCLKGAFSKVVRSSYLLNGWGEEFWSSATGWTGWELGGINLHFFLLVREFFVLHGMVGRTQRGVLTPGYFEPCNFPPAAVKDPVNQQIKIEFKKNFYIKKQYLYLREISSTSRQKKS